MNEIVQHLLNRICSLIAICLAIQYILLVFVVPYFVPETDGMSLFSFLGRITIFCIGTTAIYLWCIIAYISHFKHSGWKKVFPHLDFSGRWKTQYTSNKEQQSDGFFGEAEVTQDWLGNISVIGSYSSKTNTGVTEASWESTTFTLLVNNTGQLRAIFTFHSRRTQIFGESKLIKDGPTARGTEELNIHLDEENRPVLMEGAYYVYLQKAAQPTRGSAKWTRC